MSIQSSSVADRIVTQIGTLIILGLIFSEMKANGQTLASFFVFGAGIALALHVATLLFLGERPTKLTKSSEGLLYRLTAVCALGIIGLTYFLSDYSPLFNINTVIGASLIFLGSGRLAWRSYKEA